MLAQLTISNFAIVRELEIDFQSGMTVITGETGAGKSIAIDAACASAAVLKPTWSGPVPAVPTCVPVFR